MGLICFLVIVTASGTSVPGLGKAYPALAAVPGAGYSLPPKTADGNHLRPLTKKLKEMLKVMAEWRQSNYNAERGYPKTGQGQWMYAYERNTRT